MPGLKDTRDLGTKHVLLPVQPPPLLTWFAWDIHSLCCAGKCDFPCMKHGALHWWSTSIISTCLASPLVSHLFTHMLEYIDPDVELPHRLHHWLRRSVKQLVAPRSLVFVDNRATLVSFPTYFECRCYSSSSPRSANLGDRHITSARKGISKQLVTWNLK